MYLVSPQLFVTSEHIISDKASTSSSPWRLTGVAIGLCLSSCLLSLSFWKPGEVTELLGEAVPSLSNVRREGEEGAEL
jgi:hypothetical protein